MEAVYKAGGKVNATEHGVILDKPTAVLLKIAPENIAKSVRQGHDLVLTLKDGSQITVPGFFTEYPQDGRNDLLLLDDAGVLWWGQFEAPWTGFHFTEIESDDLAAAWLPGSGIPSWLIAGLGILGIAAVAGGGGGSSPAPAPQPPTEPTDPTKSTETTEPTEPT